MIGILGHVKIASQNAHKCLFELLVGQGVAEGVHGAVGVAQEVGEHVEVAVGAWRLGTEALDQRQDVVRRPAGHEGPQNEGDGPQSFAGPVLRFGLLTLFAGAGRLFPPALDALADGTDQIRFGGRRRLGSRGGGADVGRRGR